MSNLKFYLFSLLTYLVCSFLGFFVGVMVSYDFLITNFGYPNGEEVLAFTVYSMIFSIVSFLAGTLISFIVIHKMGKRWGKYLTFGSHPVLKLTGLSFLSFTAILILFLKINYYFNK